MPVNTCRCCVIVYLFPIHCCYHDNNRLSVSAARFDFLCKFDSVHVWHTPIDKVNIICAVFLDFPARIQTIDSNTLMAMEFEALQFTADKILPHGLFILAGSPKIGKSWLALDLCRAVATGGKLWDYAATAGDVLYFALEDRHRRIQDRLKKIKAENVNLSRLHTSLTAAGLHNGLIEDKEGER